MATHLRGELDFVAFCNQTLRQRPRYEEHVSAQNARMPFKALTTFHGAVLTHHNPAVVGAVVLPLHHKGPYKCRRHVAAGLRASSQPQPPQFQPHS
jgi:hypothetical protein